MYISDIFIFDSLLQFSSNVTKLFKVILRKTTLRNTTITLTNNIILNAINCSFGNINIIDDVGFNVSQSYVEIILDGCELLGIIIGSSLLLGPQAPTSHGIVLKNLAVLKVFILYSTIKYIHINILSYNLLLFMLQSNIIQSTTNVKVKSHLKVPSFIYLEQTQFIFSKNGSTSDNIMSFKLHNPYIYIKSCKFLAISLEISSVKHNFKQHFFYVEIMQTIFSDSFKYGDGGALYLFSDILMSNVYLLNTTFLRNNARKDSQLNHGRGGAIFADGVSMFMLIEQCVFNDNIAHESGDAVFTSRGINVNIITSFFYLQLIRSRHGSF